MNSSLVRVMAAAALVAGGLVLTPGGALAATEGGSPARLTAVNPQATPPDVTPPSTPGRLIPLPTPFGEFGFGWAPYTDDRGAVRQP